MTLLGLGWVNCGADYSRYLPRKSSGRAITGWTTLGGVLPPLALLVFGVLLNAGDPELAAAAAADPVGALAGALPTWFLVPYLLTAVGGFVSGAIMDIYSSGMAMLALGIPVHAAPRRRRGRCADGLRRLVRAVRLPQFLRHVPGVPVRHRGGDGRLDGGLPGGAVAASAHRLRADARTGPRRPRGVLLTVATVVGLGLITSGDPHIAKAVGFLLTDSAARGTLGAMNPGVVVALAVAGALYACTAPLADRFAPGGAR